MVHEVGLRSALAITIALIAAVLFFVGVDAAAAAYLYAQRRNSGLIWAPDSTVEHATTEFHYFTHVNNLGFRGPDFSRRPKSGTERIAIIGDSFTYGWGLDQDQTWPAILEQCLRSSGRPVEIANLGVPGAGPLSYADLAPRALAALHPDVLLVAVVQADDIAQCSDHPPGAGLGWRQRLGERLSHLLPGLSTIAGLTPSRQIHVTAADLRGIWRKQAHDFITGFTPDERARFDRLPSRLRELYAQGDINPGIVFYAFRRPRYLVDTANPDLPLTKTNLAELTRCLAEIRRAAEHYGARAIAVSIPYRAYVTARDMEAMREFGFDVDPALIGSDKPDAVIRAAADRAGVPFIDITSAFRAEARESELYFPVDGHFNTSGARLYATLLAPKIAAQIKE